MNRRRFIKAGVAGLATTLSTGAGNVNRDLFSVSNETVDSVKLGESGLTVSRIAMGTGTHGYSKSSDQTRLGMDNFVKLAHHAYEKGIRFFDMADGYGSQPFVGEAIKALPREKLTLLSKIWTHEDGSEHNQPVRQIIDRFRKEVGTDYFDILFMHCMMAGGWSKNRTHYMDGLSKAKQDGIVKAVGVSCHNWDALVEAADSPWVDVIMVRINPFGTVMDNTPDEVKALISKAHKNGKGLIAMKVFGEGKHVTDAEREKSLRFIIEECNVHCMTLGMPSTAQIDDAVARVMRLVKGI